MAGLLPSGDNYASPRRPNVFGDVGSQFGNENLQAARDLAMRASGTWYPFQMAGAGLLGALGLIEKGVGYGSEIVAGDTASERRLANDILAMPEAFAGFGAGARGVNILDDVTDAAVATGGRVAAAAPAMTADAIGAARAIARGDTGLLSEVLQRGGTPQSLSAMSVWHGSPHDFDRFSMDKIGTGEGAQAYGHGLYFAENEGVARGYRDALSARAAPNDARGNAFDLVQRMGGDVEGTVDILRDAIDSVVSPNTEKFLRDTLRHIEDGTFADYERPLGRLYEVNINANPEDFLDWDKPLSEQPQSVRDFANARWQQVFGRNPDPTIEGEYIAKMASPQHGIDGREWLDTGPAADQARRLREAGITGIKYFDAMSRGAGEGSRNYVLFDDRLVDILSKDGVRTPEGRAADVLGLLGSGRAADVTDEMLDMGDSVQNARLNEYLFNNYDLPMDEASRMARADQYWSDEGYRGSANDPSQYKEARPLLYVSDSPYVAGTYARGANDAQFVDVQTTPTVAPVRVNRGRSLEIDVGGGGYSHVPYDAQIVRGGGSIRNAVGDAAEGWNMNGVQTTDTDLLPRAAVIDGGFDSVVFNDVLDRGPEAYFNYTTNNIELPSGEVIASRSGSMDKEFMRRASLPSTVTATSPTNVRSRFARFDPRLSHLKNLSAGIGGVGLLGAINQERLDEQTRQYLAGGA